MAKGKIQQGQQLGAPLCRLAQCNLQIASMIYPILKSKIHNVNLFCSNYVKIMKKL